MEETPFVQRLRGHFTFDRNSWAEWNFGDAGHPMTVTVARGSGSGATSVGAYEVRTSKDRPECGVTPSATSPTGPLVGVRSDRCAQASEHGTQSGTQLVIRDCVKSNSQSWTHQADGSLTAMNKCLAADGTRVILVGCDGSDSQKWTLEPDHTVRHSDLCLDVRDGETANGIPLQLWTCSDSDNQQWARL